MSLSRVLFTITFSFFWTLSASAAPPAFIQWPIKWHAGVLVGDAGPPPATAAKVNLPTVGYGDYFYNANASAVAFTLFTPNAGRSVREVVTSTGVRVIDGPTQACTSQPIGASARFQLLPPDFLSKGKFTFIANEYYLRDSVFFQTFHWSGHFPAGSTSQIDYWHAVETNAPFRLAWGPSSTNSSEPSEILEFSNVFAGFEDIASESDFLFSVPSTCKKSSSKQRSSSIDQEEKKVPASSSPHSGVSGNAWPLQWHANSFYTGNNFGFQSVIGEPPVVPFSLIGHYYYDWSNLRECNVWTDAMSNVRTKTVIVNKTFHIVTFATNSCLIVPTDPVDGPLKPTWPTALNYLDDELLLPPAVSNPASYARAQHFFFDAFQVGVDHSFHYWQTTDTQIPLQFQGPVLEVFPYGQSMMVWSQFEKGLSGVDIDDIFSVPSDCKHVGPNDNVVLNPLIQLQLALYRQSL